MRRRGFIALAVLAVGLLFVVPSVVEYYTDWLWFRELGFEQVFLRTLNAQATVFGATFVAVFAFLGLNLRIARGALRRPHIVIARAHDGRPITLQGDQLTVWMLPVAAVLSLLFGLSAASNWLSWLNFFNAVPFGDRDPLFGRDVAFYVFRLPVWQSIR